MGNDVPGTPFTIDFDDAGGQGRGAAGHGQGGLRTHAVIVSLYDSGGGLIDQQTLDAELWDLTPTDQNYETFFGAKFDTAIVSKIEILNASSVNYANALIFDQLSWSHTPDAGYVFDASTAVPAVTGNVLANDADPAGGTLTFSGYTQPANGSVVYKNDGTFTYTSDPGYTGSDTFTYTVADDDGLTDTATVTIQVSNAAPTISSDGGGDNAALNRAENTTGVTTVAANDADGHTPTFSITGGADSALFDIDSNTGVLIFKMAPDYENPSDSGVNNVYDVQVTAADGHGGVDTQTISITVNDANDAPIARPDGVHLSFDGDDFVEVADHSSLQMTNEVTMEAWINHAGTGTGSQIIVNKEGEYELGITADTGEIKFAIARPDNTWAWHDTGHLVTAGDWTHVAVTYDGVAGEAKTYINGELVDTFAQSGVMGDVYSAFNDLFIGGRENATNQRFQGQIDDVRIWSSTRTQGEIQSGMDDQLTGSELNLVGNWRLDEAAGGAVVDQSAFGNDGVLGGSEGAAAVPSYQGYVTDQDTVLNIAAGTGVLANDFDADLDGLTVTNLDTTGMLGNLVLNVADGSFSYDPNGAFDYLDVGEQATETFTYTANDGSVDSNTVIVTITVTGVEDTPVITATSTGTVAEDGTLTANGTLAITDVDTNDNPIDFPDEASTLGDSGYGDFALVGGTWTYTLNNGHGAVQALDVGQSLTDTHTFTASDGLSTQVVTITINGTNDAPVVSGTVTANLNEGDLGDAPALAGGSLSISDIDTADTPAFAAVGPTAGDSGYGSFVLSGGTWTFTLDQGAVQDLDAGDTVTDSHTFVASDDTSQPVTVTITGTDDQPVVSGTTSGVVQAGSATSVPTPISGTLGIADVDQDDTPVFADVPATLGAQGYGHFALSNGIWTYVPDAAALETLAPGEQRTDSMVFTATDGTTQAVTVTLLGANVAVVEADAPSAPPDAETRMRHNRARRPTPRPPNRCERKPLLRTPMGRAMRLARPLPSGPESSGLWMSRCPSSHGML